MDSSSSSSTPAKIVERIKVTGTPEVNSLSFNKVHSIHSLATIKAPKFEELSRASRAPIDLLTIIDVSGSMGGTKLNLVKETLLFVISQLKNEDRLSIITFESSARVHSPLTELTPSGKSVATAIVNGLAAGGGTDIGAGLTAGLNQIKDRVHSRAKNDIVSILLLTDGQTGGINTTAGFKALLDRYTSSFQDPFSLTTFGFGSDVDSKLLRELSELANGMFYFIEKQADISPAFADCLGGLLSIVAQNIFLTIKALGEVTIQALHSPYKLEILEKTKEYQLKINDLYSEESKDIVVDLTLPALKEPSLEVPTFHFHVKYFSLLDRQDVVVENVMVLNRPSLSEEEERNLIATPNTEVLRQTNRLFVASALETASSLGDKSQYDAGQKVLAEAIEKIEKVNKADEFNKKLVQELHRAKAQMVSPSVWNNNKAQVYAQAQASNYQRSNVSSPMYQQAAQMEMQQQQVVWASQNTTPSVSAPPISSSFSNVSPRRAAAPYPSPAKPSFVQQPQQQQYPNFGPQQASPYAQQQQQQYPNFGPQLPSQFPSQTPYPNFGPFQQAQQPQQQQQQLPNFGPQQASPYAQQQQQQYPNFGPQIPQPSQTPVSVQPPLLFSQPQPQPQPQTQPSQPAPQP